MSRWNLFFILITGLTLSCQKESSSVRKLKSSETTSYQGIGAHSATACPDLRGNYEPADGVSTQLQFNRNDKGEIVILSKGTSDSQFNELITVNGVTNSKSLSGIAQAKCVGGRILMTQSAAVSTSSTHNFVEFTIEPVPGGLNKYVKQKSRNAPTLIFYKPI